jgi:hypothetical protein
MNVVCYVRPWNEEQFKVICQNAFPDDNVIYISDFKKSKFNLLHSWFEKYLNEYSSLDSNSVSELTDEEVQDVIRRCRLLRSLDSDEALKFIVCMSKAIEQIFSEYEPSLGIGLTVDSYVIDLLRLRLDKINADYLGVIVSFVNGYFRLTARGEYKCQYIASALEVENVYQSLLIDKERPHFLQRIDSQFSQAKIIISNIFKDNFRTVYYEAVKVISKEKANYHYLTNTIVGSNRKDLSLNLSSPGWETELEQVEQGVLKIFLPLQYFPEATVDYWVPNIDYIEYEKILFKLLEQTCSQSVKVFIKEHPAILGLRPRGFYKNILAFKNVVIIPAFVSSDAIIDGTDCCFVWTGSAGFETALRGKPVVHLGSPYYLSGQWFYYLESVYDLSLAIKWIENKMRDSITIQEQKSMIEHILSCSLPGVFKQPKRNILGKWCYNYEDMKLVGLSIAKFINESGNVNS